MFLSVKSSIYITMVSLQDALESKLRIFLKNAQIVTVLHQIQI